MKHETMRRIADDGYGKDTRLDIIDGRWVVICPTDFAPNDKLSHEDYAHTPAWEALEEAGGYWGDPSEDYIYREPGDTPGPRCIEEWADRYNYAQAYDDSQMEYANDFYAKTGLPEPGDALFDLINAGGVTEEQCKAYLAWADMMAKDGNAESHAFAKDATGELREKLEEKWGVEQ